MHLFHNVLKANESHKKNQKKQQHNFNSIYSSLQMCSTLTTSTGRNCCLSQKKQEYKNILNSVRLTWHIYYNFFSPSVTYVSG